MFTMVDSEVGLGSCPFCAKQSFKYKEGEAWMFLCHSCQRNFSFSKAFPDSILESKNSVAINYNSVLGFCQKLSTLPSDHLAVKYVRGRKIPETFFDNLYFTEKLGKIAKAAKKEMSDGFPKLIIPFFDEDNNLFGLQARSLDGSSLRYVTLMFEEKEKIFGMERVNMEEPFFCVEGPIDSLFLNNCVAMAGTSRLESKYKTLATVCLDNEPRNPQTVHKMAKYLEDGFKLVIWPERIKEKDINEMILKGIDVDSVVSENVFSGLTGKMRLNTWKKV